VKKSPKEKDTLGCEHGRPVGQGCPHCLGIGAASLKSPKEEEAIDKKHKIIENFIEWSLRDIIGKTTNARTQWQLEHRLKRVLMRFERSGIIYSGRVHKGNAYMSDGKNLAAPRPFKEERAE